MVTLSCLIVLASLFSQLSTTIPNSPAPKIIEILFFYYIAKLSLIFAAHTYTAVVRFRREEEKENIYPNKLFEYRPQVREDIKKESTLSPPTIATAWSVSKQIVNLNKQRKHFVSVKMLDKIFCYGGCVMDVTFMIALSAYVIYNRNIG